MALRVVIGVLVLAVWVRGGDRMPPAVPGNPEPGDGAVVSQPVWLLSWSSGFDDRGRFVNGGFEDGDLRGWRAVTGSGAEHEPWRVTDGGGVFDNGRAVSGSYFIQNGFDGDGGLTYDLFKQVYIPAGVSKAVLVWYDRIQWDFGGSEPRLYEVTLRTADGVRLLAVLHELVVGPNSCGDTGTVRHEVDLMGRVPRIGGAIVRINFHQFIPETFTGPAQFDLDGVSLDCDGYRESAGVVFDVYLGPSADRLERVARTDHPFVRLPSPLGLGDYVWQVIARRRGSSATTGRPWTFEVRGVRD